MSLTAGRDYKTRAVPGTAIGAARQAYFLGNISAVELERTLERLCIEVRHRARREIQCRLTDGLSSEQRQQLDALTQRRAETSQSWLALLRQMPEAGKPEARRSIR
jgi:hypothetical protein